MFMAFARQNWPLMIWLVNSDIEYSVSELGR